MRKNSSNTYSFFSLCMALLVFLIISILSGSVHLSQSITIATVDVVPSTVTACIGQSFSINVNISCVLDLYGWGFRLSWNSTLLDAVNVTEGPFLKNDGETFFVPKINNTAGHVTVDCTLLGNVPGVSGNGTLASVKFYVEEGGESILNLYNTTLVNSLEQPIVHVAVDGNGIFILAHDVAVISVVASPTTVLPWQSIQINATVENQGGYAESLNVTAYYNSESIETQSVSLDIGKYAVLTFLWDTTGVGKGDYTISAEASVVPDETDTVNNIKTTDSVITVLSPGHDVAINGVTPSKTVVGQGYSLFISITAKNYGSFAESFNVIAYSNTTQIETREITLTSGNSTTLTFTWNTTGVAKGNHTITAEATILPGETDLGDNTLEGGWIIVTLIGDINADGKVDIEDVYTIALHFGYDRYHPYYVPNYDVNGDEKTDIEDIFITALHYGETDP